MFPNVTAIRSRSVSMSHLGMIFPTDRAILLSDVTRETRWLEIDCRQCERSGRLSVRRLIGMHGPSATAWSVVEALTADCPQRAPDVHWTKACKVRCPTLSRYSAVSPYRPPPWAGKPR